MTLCKTQRNSIVQHYDKFVLAKIADGYEVYFVNFMFNPLPGSTDVRKRIMVQEVNRVFDILQRHVVRKPRSNAWFLYRPVLIGCPDFPVRKRVIQSSVVAFGKLRPEWKRPNEGMHFNALIILPPRRDESLAMRGVRQSRLSTGLAYHFRDKQDEYLTKRLSTIHVTTVTYGTMVPYTLKSFSLGLTNSDDIHVR